MNWKRIIAIFFLAVYTFCAYPQENYIRTYTPKVAVAHGVSMTEGNSRVETDFYDTFGRKVQHVLHKASPEGEDIVDLTEYDTRSNVLRSWLPTACSTGDGFHSAEIFESQENPADRHADFSYENSARSKLLSVTGKNSTNSSIQTREWFSYDNVFCYEPISGGVRNVGSYSIPLKHTEITDEDGRRIIVVSSPFGEKLLERRFAASDTLETYYVYDSYHRLCAVLPPMAAEAMRQTASYYVTEGSAMDKFAFIYRYDNRGLCVEKKIPGTGWQNFVYDAEKNVVFSQTAEQLAKNEWTFYRYDNLGRILMRGTLRSIYGREQLQEMHENLSQSFSYSGYGDYGYGSPQNQTEKVDIVLYYDDYSFLYLPLAAALEENSNPHGSAKGRLTGKWIRALGTDMGEISCYCYDYRGRCTKEISYNDISRMKHTEERIFKHNDLMTNNIKQHYISSDKFLKENRILTYDTADRLKNDRSVVSDMTGETNTITPVIKNYSYDNLNRLYSVSINNIERQEVSYYPRGRLASIAYVSVSDTLGTSSPNAFVQNIVYDSHANNLGQTYRSGKISQIEETFSLDNWSHGIQYDSCGRITKTKAAEDNQQTASFPNLIINATYTEELGYDKNGNISSLKRLSQNPIETYNLLSFNYDGNKLLSSSDNRLPGFNNYIERQIQNSPLYYKPCSEENPYLYDLDGNETRNLSQNMAYAHYNILNLPDSLVFTDGNTLLLTYMADGRRIKTVAKTYATPLGIPEDYGSGLGDPISVSEEIVDRGLVFKDGELTELRIEGGYITLVDEATGQRRMHRYYYRTDYRGDVRQVVDGMTGEVLQNIKYLPTGAVFSISNPAMQPYKFGGKEEISLHGWGMYDSHARLQYKNLPRFAQVDPLAEDYYAISPYAFCGNDFVNYIDPMGGIIVHYVDNIKYTYECRNNVYGFYDPLGEIYTGNDLYMTSLIEELNWLISGDFGKDLVDFIISNPNELVIKYETVNNTDGRVLHWNPQNLEAGVDINGNKEASRGGIIIGHELGHVQDKWNGTEDNTTWVPSNYQYNTPDITRAEIYACNVENAIRHEHGEPLRQGYVYVEGDKTFTSLINRINKIYYPNHSYKGLFKPYY